MSLNMPSSLDVKALPHSVCHSDARTRKINKGKDKLKNINNDNNENKDYSITLVNSRNKNAIHNKNKNVIKKNKNAIKNKNKNTIKSNKNAIKSKNKNAIKNKTNNKNKDKDNNEKELMNETSGTENSKIQNYENEKDISCQRKVYGHKKYSENKQNQKREPRVAFLFMGRQTKPKTETYQASKNTSHRRVKYGIQ